MKTKIIATIGPKSEDQNVIAQLIKAGASIFRLNLSHGDLAWHEEIIQKLKDFQNIEILIDTKGPEIRTGEIKNNITVKKGDTLLLLCGNTTDFKDVDFDIPVLFKNLPNIVKKGYIIALDSGNIMLEVESISNETVFTNVLNDGVIRSFRHINIPNAHIDMPILTESDKKILKKLLNKGFEYIAVSFTRNKEDIIEIKKFINNSNVKIIAKIESSEAVKNIDEILDISDAIMIARGDLGVETPWYKLPILEEELIKKAKENNKPVIVATQMLTSMIDNNFPSRADVMDVSIAVQLGATHVMLSDETTIGSYPVKSVKVMKKITEYAEGYPIFPID